MTNGKSLDMLTDKIMELVKDVYLQRAVTSINARQEAKEKRTGKVDEKQIVEVILWQMI